MSYYSGYNYFTRKQCNIIYRAFKEGKIVPPKDVRGKQKKPGFVYDFECAHTRHGFYMSEEDELFNCQYMALSTVVSLIVSKDYEKAQAILNGEDADFNLNYLPSGMSPKKMWKRVL